MANPVTDPALLAQLNAPDPKDRVTDPALLAALEGTAAPAAAAEKPGIASDVAKSAGIGLVKGGLGLAGTLGDLTDLGATGIEKLSNPVNRYFGLQEVHRQPQGASIFDSIPGAADLQRHVENVTGKFYEPKTVAGEYAQTAGEFAPALIGGPETLAAKLATRVAIPTIASETAGQLTKGTAVEPYARVAGAMLSPLAAGGVEQAANAINGRVEGMSRAAGNHLIKGVQADGPASVQARLAELGPDAMLADGGPAMLGTAQGAAGSSLEARSALTTPLKARDVATNERLHADVNRALGPADHEYNPMDPELVTREIEAHRTAVDRANYQPALDNAPPVQIAPIMRNLIDSIEQAPVGGPEHTALTRLQRMMTRVTNEPVLDASGHPVYDRLGNERWQEVHSSHDDAGVLHKVKGILDNVIEYDGPGLGTQPGALRNADGTLRQMRGAINDVLETQVPGYANANAVSAPLARRQNAVQEGTQYLGSGKTTPSPGRFAAEFAPREPGEKIALAKGSRGEIERILGTKANDLVALGNALQGEGGWNTAKIATVHGQPAADELVATVARNKAFRETHQKISEGAQTDIRKAAREEFKPTPATEIPLINSGTSAVGLPLTIAKKGVQHVVNALTNTDPSKSAGEVARALTEQGAARDQRLMAVVDAINKRQRNAAITAGGRRATDAVTAALLAHQEIAGRRQ